MQSSCLFFSVIFFDSSLVCQANLESQLDCTANKLAISTNRLSELEKVKAELETQKDNLQVTLTLIAKLCFQKKCEIRSILKN